MVNYQDVPPQKLITALAQTLEKDHDAIQAPDWANYVKTGTSRERRPTQENWWELRSAALLRAVATLGPIGVNKLRTKYGGRKNRGHRPDRFARASGNIIRKSLQQLETAGLVKAKEDGRHKGKVLTPQGHSLLTKTALAILKEEKKETQ
jgi:small subunit ribosomal protein S19e